MNNYRPSFLSSIPPVVKNLIAINAILWLATLLSPGIFRRWGIALDLTDVLGMHYWASDKFNLVQLITYMFMHGGFGHLFFNMFALYMFGGVLENFWGPKRFLVFYLITGIGAGVVQQIFWTVEYYQIIADINQAIKANSGEMLLPYQHFFEKQFDMSSLSLFRAPDLIELKRMFLNLPVTVGASGSVFGLLLAFGWLFPDVKLMMLFFPVPIKARIFVLIYGVAELFLGVANFSGDSVAHFAHLGGMLFGIILILIWKKRPYRF
jgi:membrane associated rhomboid family serine protease